MKRKSENDRSAVKPEKGQGILRRILRWLLLLALILGVLGAVALFTVNAVVTVPGKTRIMSPEEAMALEDVDCILVLGCQVKPSGEPSHMLYDRVLQGVELARGNAAPVLFMTGDSRREGYDETGTMKALAVENGIPETAVVTDPYGLSTYDSIRRAKEIFGYDKILIVTQEYHLYRALYIAGECGIDAYGIASNPRPYGGQLYRDLREVAARAKDFLYCLIDVKPEMAYTLPDGHPMKKET